MLVFFLGEGKTVPPAKFTFAWFPLWDWNPGHIGGRRVRGDSPICAILVCAALKDLDHYQYINHMLI